MNHLGLFFHIVPRIFVFLVIAGCIHFGPQRYFYSNSVRIQAGAPISGLDEGNIPQGLAFWEDQNLLLTSSYFNNGKPSRIAMINQETGELVRNVGLKETNGNDHHGHVGGIAITASNLWVASDTFLYRFNLEDLLLQDSIAAETRYKIEDLRAASFCTTHEDLVWVGEFSLGKKYPANPAHSLVASDGIRQNA